MAHELPVMRMAIMAADGVEGVEPEEPRAAQCGSGAQSDLLPIHPAEIQGPVPLSRLVPRAMHGVILVRQRRSGRCFRRVRGWNWAARNRQLVKADAEHLIRRGARLSGL
jgi:hypothetical protein